MKKHIILVLFAAVFLMSAKTNGCKGSKHTESGGQTATATRSAAFLTEKLKKQDLKSVKSMTARAQLRVDNEGQAISAGANIIWIRDSVLWINVKKFGFEAVRALVTRDSVFVLNRLEKTYSVSGLDAIERKFNLPAGFELLQRTLLAQAWLFDQTPLKPSLEEGLHKLVGADGSFGSAYWIEDGSYLLKKEHFVQQKDEKMVTLGFDGYQKLNGFGQFPYLRRIEAYSPESGNMEMDVELSDVEINDNPAYRFEIPAHYKRADF